MNDILIDPYAPPAGARLRTSTVPGPKEDGTPTFVPALVQHDDRWYEYKAALEEIGISMDWESSSTALLQRALSIQRSKMHFDLKTGQPIVANEAPPATPINDEFKGQVTSALQQIMTMGQQLAASIEGLANRVSAIETAEPRRIITPQEFSQPHTSRKKQKQGRR